MVLSGREKATIFLSILGAETSARVLRYLPDEIADLIASGINNLPSPSPQALTEVLADFKSFMALPESPESAPRPQLEHKVRSAAPAEPPRPKRQYNVLMYERPQVAAFLVAQLPEEEREDAFKAMPREKGMVMELMNGLRRTPFSDKLALKLKEKFKEKVFS
ncbi:MAG: hypothetical protein JW782_06720 [Candidatus Saganbacteria bacterium]|nr:hypothetical protein [Candidatus Saganbacteria bacterium]